MLDKIIHKNILELVGNTPLIELGKIFKNKPFRVIAKLEKMNPGGSVKDRVGVAMVEDAEKRGIIKPGDTVIESTSGNTGIGIALACAVKGYRCIFVIPDKMSKEKVRLLQSYGAKVIVTPTGLPADNPESYYGMARRLAREIPHSFYTNQYENQMNPEIHYKTTAPEIVEQTDGDFDYFMTTMGTGGTISGCSKYFKEHLKGVKCIGIDPEGSILGEYFHTGKTAESRVYKVEGIGEDMIPKTTWFEYLDDVIKVNDAESFRMTRLLARLEGIHGGGSTGSTIAGIMKYSDKIKENSTVITILPDSGERYLTKFYSDAWLIENDFVKKDLKISDFVDLKDHKEIFSVTAKTSVKKVIDIMNKTEYDLLPVCDGGITGTVYKKEIVKAAFDDILEMERPIAPYLAPPVPVISSKKNISDLYHVLKVYEAVVIEFDNHKLFYRREDFISSIGSGGDLFEV
ncbi:MAG: pyridoxal-phosphate dependent enzyme [Candidatus Thermoplasmatota archaeon]|nr:pyridoxal-phosphate dependent enzyme [Candidatus Thermoplasmatota archaeon]MCL5963905.1 pyridoxal-phosphate dependent enzyme [Candidatus Thermoplasmatota archaeon]